MTQWRGQAVSESQLKLNIQPQMKFAVEIMDLIIKGTIEKAQRSAEPFPIVPLLQSCNLIKSIALKYLLQSIELHTIRQQRSFLMRFPISAYAGIQSIRVTIREPDDAAWQLVTVLKSKIVDAMVVKSPVLGREEVDVDMTVDNWQSKRIGIAFAELPPAGMFLLELFKPQTLYIPNYIPMSKLLRSPGLLELQHITHLTLGLKKWRNLIRPPPLTPESAPNFLPIGAELFPNENQTIELEFGSPYAAALNKWPENPLGGLTVQELAMITELKEILVGIAVEKNKEMKGLGVSFSGLPHCFCGEREERKSKAHEKFEFRTCKGKCPARRSEAEKDIERIFREVSLVDESKVSGNILSRWQAFGVVV